MEEVSLMVAHLVHQQRLCDFCKQVRTIMQCTDGVPFIFSHCAICIFFYTTRLYKRA